MRVLFPAYLPLLLLGLVPVVLYFFRRKSRKVDVSTLLFFKALAREHQESAWLRRLKKLVSLLLTLLILAGAVLGLARVIFSPKSEDVRNVVILLDRSASMGAKDASGRSRLDVAKEAIKTRLEGLPEEVGVSLLTYDSRPEVLEPRTLKRRSLLSRLEEVEVRPVSQEREAALNAALTLAKLETPAIIWHVTDSPRAPVEPKAAGADASETGTPEEGDAAPAAEAEENEAPTPAAASVPEAEGEEDSPALPEGVQIQLVDVGLEKALNVGITTFQVRPAPLSHSKFEAYLSVSVNDAAEEAVPVKLEVSLGGVPVQLRELELEPGSSERLILPLEGAEGQMLRVDARAEGDCFAADDTVVEPLPTVRPIVAAWITEDKNADPFTELALSAIQSEGELDLWKGTKDVWPLGDQVDVVIFDGWLPETWPEDLPVIVINPPGSSGPIHAALLENGGVPYDSIRVGNEQHPVLFRVSSGRVALTQTSVFDVSGSLEPLWFAGNEPVLAAGEVKGQRLVIMGFSPAWSEQLPLMASFPILMGNAIFWCAETAKTAAERIQENRTGDVVSVGAGTLTWTQWDKGALKNTRQTVESDLIELDRVGVWENESGRKGVSHLLSGKETNIAVRAAPDSDSEKMAAAESRTRSGLFTGNVTWLILAALVFLLVIESWLFHRHAVY